MLVDFNTISDESRIWIYASEQKLTYNHKKYIAKTVVMILNNSYRVNKREF